MASLFQSRLILLVLSLSVCLVVVEIRAEDGDGGAGGGGDVASVATVAPLKISSGFHHFAHDLRSGDVFALNEKQIQITNLNYDGTGPAAWFAVGNNGTMYQNERGGLHHVTLLPDETLSCRVLRPYNGTQTIVLTLPNNITIHDILFLTMFCFQFDHNFGYFEIPQNISPSTLPPIDQNVTYVEDCPRLHGRSLGGAAPVTAQANTFVSILVVAVYFLKNNFIFRNLLHFSYSE